MLEDLMRSKNYEVWEVMQRDKLLCGIETLLRTGTNFGIAADFDENISVYGKSEGLNPSDKFIHPTVQKAFIDMRQRGLDIVIISSRGAHDIARIINTPGIGIIGSLGWETFVADTSDPTQGESYIHPRFQPFQPQITGILGDIRRSFQSGLDKIPAEIETEPNIELPITDGGTILMQRKGFNAEYPEGINLTINLSRVALKEREKYVSFLEELYVKGLNIHTHGLDEIQKLRLKELCGFKINQGFTTKGEPTNDVEIRPVSQNSKTGAVVQLLREAGDSKRLPNYAHMPHHDFWIYSGDHVEQDGAVMRAGNLAYKLTNKRRGVIGVWSKPHRETYRTVRGADVVVSGVLGNAEVITGIANLVKKYK